MDDKTLPGDDSDSNLPGRIEESDWGYGPAEPEIDTGEDVWGYGPPEPEIEAAEDGWGYFDEPESETESGPKSRALVIAMVAFVIVAAGFFSYYFVNQSDIDSQILDGALPKSQEQKMASQYGVGEFGSDHDHAALAMFVDGVQINFGMPQFQLQSGYIHFEDHNPYMVHKHATNVPLKMLFESLGMEVTPQCITFSYKMDGKFCADRQNSMTFVINGKYYSDISEYEIRHNDRILISYGDPDLVLEQLEYLNSLEIHDIPRQERLVPGKDISV